MKLNKLNSPGPRGGSGTVRSKCDRCETLGTVHILRQQPLGLEMLTLADGGGGGFEPC
jgi:hypothetical protein